MGEWLDESVPWSDGIFVVCGIVGFGHHGSYVNGIEVVLNECNATGLLLVYWGYVNISILFNATVLPPMAMDIVWIIVVKTGVEEGNYAPSQTESESILEHRKL